MNFRIRVFLCLFSIWFNLPFEEVKSQSESIKPFRYSVTSNIFAPFIDQYQITLRSQVYYPIYVQFTYGLIEDLEDSPTRRGGRLLIPEIQMELNQWLDGPYYVGIYYRDFIIRREYDLWNSLQERQVIGEVYEERETRAAGVIFGYHFLVNLTQSLDHNVFIVLDVFGGLYRKRIFIRDNRESVTGIWIEEPNFIDDSRGDRAGMLNGIRVGFNVGLAF